MTTFFTTLFALCRLGRLVVIIAASDSPYACSGNINRCFNHRSSNLDCRHRHGNDGISHGDNRTPGTHKGQQKEQVAHWRR